MIRDAIIDINMLPLLPLLTVMIQSQTQNIIHVLVLPSFQQPTFHKFTKTEWHSHSQFKCLSSFQVNF